MVLLVVRSVVLSFAMLYTYVVIAQVMVANARVANATREAF